MGHSAYTHIYIWELCRQKQVSQAGICKCIPQYSVGCNYLSLPDIPVSGDKVLIYIDAEYPKNVPREISALIQAIQQEVFIPQFLLVTNAYFLWWQNGANVTIHSFALWFINESKYSESIYSLQTNGTTYDILNFILSGSWYTTHKAGLVWMHRIYIMYFYDTWKETSKCCLHFITTYLNHHHIW